MDERALRLDLAKELAFYETYQPVKPADLHVIWVLSGPGTILSPLKSGNEPWHSWFDSRRIQKGIDLFLEGNHAVDHWRSNPMTVKDETRPYPVFFYNGITDENRALRSVMASPAFPIPRDQVVIQDGYTEGKETRAILHTGHQARGFFQHELSKTSGTVALVTHAAHMPRALRYCEHYFGPGRPKIRPFPIPSDLGWAAIYYQEEIERIIQYASNGDLSLETYQNLSLG